MKLMALSLATVAAVVLAPARAHDIYTGVKGKLGNFCCGANDCSLTTYRESGDRYEFLTREGHWVHVPSDRIQFLPIPGDPPHPDAHAAHLCYGPVMGYEHGDDLASGDEQTIHLYCAFISPGSY